MVVVEHSLGMIKAADFGPESGDGRDARASRLISGEALLAAQIFTAFLVGANEMVRQQFMH